jgi:hypothetical protein
MMTVRKGIILILSVALLGVAAAQFAGCEKFLLPEIELAQDTLLFSAKGGVQSVRITTNVITTAEPAFRDQTWLGTDPVWFDENTTLQVTVGENTGEKRTSVIPIKSEAITKSLTIIQEGI